MVVLFAKWAAAILAALAAAWVVAHTSSDLAVHKLAAELSEAFALALDGRQVFSVLTDIPCTRPKDHPQKAMGHSMSVAESPAILTFWAQPIEV